MAKDDKSGGQAGRLEEYRKKRDFDRTPEPGGGKDPLGAGASHEEARLQPPDQSPGGEQFSRFVVQEHHARSLHWDFRLETGGVLRSWAVPKGPPTEPGVKRLAVATEDHPLEYIDFEGTIPEGNYGAGTVEIWDHGRYAIAQQTENKLLLALYGKKLRGAYHMVRTKDNQWLMWKLDESKVKK